MLGGDIQTAGSITQARGVQDCEIYAPGQVDKLVNTNSISPARTGAAAGLPLRRQHVALRTSAVRSGQGGDGWIHSVWLCIHECSHRQALIDRSLGYAQAGTLVTIVSPMPQLRLSSNSKAREEAARGLASVCFRKTY